MLVLTSSAAHAMAEPYVSSAEHGASEPMREARDAGEASWNRAEDEPGGASEPTSATHSSAADQGRGKRHLEDPPNSLHESDEIAMQIDSLPSTPEGAGSFGSDNLEPPEEPLNVTVNVCRGLDGKVLYTAQ